MRENQNNHQAVAGKRQILVVDDEAINRVLLGGLLEQQGFEVLYAEDGAEALELAQKHRMTLSLILLDLLMPKVDGREVLRTIREDRELRRIPVIVLTSDQGAEVESLRLGAIDFIPKPYPDSEVVLARVIRTVELSEDRNTIRETERDALTGLYNREFFYRYAAQYDLYHKDTPMDAVVIDVSHFHMINERHGRAYGDRVLRIIGEKIQELLQGEGGICCRLVADTFMVYCPHRDDYEKILEEVTGALSAEEGAAGRLRLRIGLYSCVDKSIDMERRFDRAKMAAATIRKSFAKSIAEYDDTLHKTQLYTEQLLEDFQEALKQHQFRVYYQPKFDIRPDIPVLAGAEALVRWEHPKLGMISPGVFIPLFEGNGLIRQLDAYVWREAAIQIREWRARFGFTVPVSVNVSRVDIYDPNLISDLQQLLEEYGLTSSEINLEITESAYTRDSKQIIDTVKRLRALGFRIEMDDFGTGYSSLNMISSLPIDALKLDMQFIRMAFEKGRDTHMLEVIIDIADYLSVPVIAEGVETEEQLYALKAMGCDIVQGYYFSRPVPSTEYERFFREEQQPLSGHEEAFAGSGKAQDIHPGKIVHALSSGFERIFYVDIHSSHYVEFGSQGSYEDLQMQRSGENFFAEMQRFLSERVVPADRERILLLMNRDTFLEQIRGGQGFSLTYRLVVDGKTVYQKMKAENAHTHAHQHIVIGISNVDELMSEAMSRDELKQKNREFNSIAQALAADYFSIYYVDMETDQFVEYSASHTFRKLGIEQGGEDFFGLARKNAEGIISFEDLERFRAEFTKENILAKLQTSQVYSLSYRLMLDGKPTYVCLRANRMDDQGDPHIVIGLSNIDPEVRREAERITGRER